MPKYEYYDHKKNKGGLTFRPLTSDCQIWLLYLLNVKASDLTGKRAMLPNRDSEALVRFEAFTPVTMKNAVFWDIKTQFVPHRKQISSLLQSPAS
jgi:hypothetical protein